MDENELLESFKKLKVYEDYKEIFDNISGDVAIVYSPRFRRFGISVLDGGSSVVAIKYCPWTGKKLPESLGNAWFDVLESMGIEEPDDPRILAEFFSEEWWIKREL